MDRKILVCALIAAAGLVVGRVTAQGQQMPEAMVPGPEHEQLAKMAGEWSVAGKYWMAPGAQPAPFAGTSVIRPILDGRFMQEEFKAPAMGFEGMGLIGYDRAKDVYTFLWVDSTKTWMSPSEGTRDDETGVTTLTGTTYNAMTGAWEKTKTVSADDGEDRVIVKMYRVEDGEDVQTMELVYTRGEEGGAEEGGR